MVKLKNMRGAKCNDEATSRDCPVCRRAALTQVTYVSGDELRDVYVVDVCRICGWNHLDASDVLGSAASAAARGKRTTAARQAGRA